MNLNLSEFRGFVRSLYALLSFKMLLTLWEEFAYLTWVGQCGFSGHLIANITVISQGVFSSSPLKLNSAHPIWNHDIFGWLLSNCQHLCHMVGGQISVCHHIMCSPYLVGSIEQVLRNPAVIHSLHMTGPRSAELWWISFENCCDGYTSRHGYNLAYNLIFCSALRWNC